jgi:hypothetical protein
VGHGSLEASTTDLTWTRFQECIGIDLEQDLWEARKSVETSSNQASRRYGRRARRTASLALLCAIGSILVVAVSPAQAATATFGYSGGEQSFVVPSGNSTVKVLVVGGSGGESSVPGGAAAEVGADLNVTPGQVLYVEVGGIGEDSGDGGEGGFNGGAAGGSASGGGGGASDIRLLPLSSGLISDTRLIVAGGAGGGGGEGLDGGGGGGDAGSAGGISGGGWAGGGAGTESAGGAGGEGCIQFGENGQLGLGGDGGFGESGNNGGGGGGGGYYGGGGGGPGCSSGGGGGGGGSSLVPAGGKLETALASAAPLIQISYTLPTPPVTPVPPAAPVAPSPPTAPDTALGSHPRKNLKTTKNQVGVKFGFSSTIGGATFKCKLDKAAFSSCVSPKSYKVKVGKHKFSVEAVSAGLTDPSPAVFSFKVTKTS